MSHSNRRKVAIGPRRHTLHQQPEVVLRLGDVGRTNEGQVRVFRSHMSAEDCDHQCREHRDYSTTELRTGAAIPRMKPDFRNFSFGSNDWAFGEEDVPMAIYVALQGVSRAFNRPTDTEFVEASLLTNRSLIRLRQVDGMPREYGDRPWNTPKHR